MLRSLLVCQFYCNNYRRFYLIDMLIIFSTSQHSEFTLGCQCSLYVPMTLGRICMQSVVQQLTHSDTFDHDDIIDRPLQRLPARLRVGIVELLRKQRVTRQKQLQQLVFHANDECSNRQVQSNMTKCGNKSLENVDELYAKLCQYFKGVVA